MEEPSEKWQVRATKHEPEQSEYEHPEQDCVEDVVDHEPQEGQAPFSFEEAAPMGMKAAISGKAPKKISARMSSQPIPDQ